MMEVGRWRNSGVSRRRPSKDENLEKLAMLGRNPATPLPGIPMLAFKEQPSG
jgi:hypothetical protein